MANKKITKLLSGPIFNPDIALPVEMARFILDGLDESKVQSIWDELNSVLESSERKFSKLFEKPKAGHVPGAATIARVGLQEVISLSSNKEFDSIYFDSFDDLGFVGLLRWLEMFEYEDIKNLISKYGKDKLYAVLILSEAGECSYDEINKHVLNTVKAEREMMLAYITKSSSEILASGRKIGTYRNKEKAKTRQQGLIDAAIDFFINIDSAGGYDDCVTWIKNQPKLKLFREYSKGKMLTDKRIGQIISGTKDLALNRLAQKQVKT